jgi:hypothetical protein
VDVEYLTKQLRQAAVEHVGQAPEEEFWPDPDCSDLRKSSATTMIHLV